MPRSVLGNFICLRKAVTATFRQRGRWVLGVVTIGLLGLASVPAPVSRAASAPATAPAAMTTPDEDWLVDEQGRQYQLGRIDKKLPHVRLDGNRLRTSLGVTVDLAGEDDATFFVKVYRPVESTADAPPARPAEDKAKIAASYAVDLETSTTMRFEPFGEGLPRTGQWRYGFVLVDMNGDGHLDIVHGPPRRASGPPIIFLGDGAGRWRQWQATFPPARYGYGNVAVADFNRDGHLDIAMGIHLLGMTVLVGDGAGRFTTASTGMDPLDPHTAFSSHALVAVDWDGDGHIDLVALGEGPRLGSVRSGKPSVSGGPSSSLVFYRNRGDATWEKRVGARPQFGDTLILAPSRVDGRPWLVAGTIERGRQDLVVKPGDPFTTEVLPGLRPRATVRGAAIADFDGDGHEDLAIGYTAYEGEEWRSGIDLVIRRPDKPAERRGVFVQASPRAVMALGSGDLDGDGRPDLVALSGDGETVVLRNSGGGRFTREDVQLTERVPGCQGYSVRVQDLDRDGRAEIVAGFAGEAEGMASIRRAGCPGQGSLRAWRSRPRS